MAGRGSLGGGNARLALGQRGVGCGGPRHLRLDLDRAIFGGGDGLRGIAALPRERFQRRRLLRLAAPARRWRSSQGASALQCALQITNYTDVGASALQCALLCTSRCIQDRDVRYVLYVLSIIRIIIR
jgi:hypothetical protein